MTVTCPECKSVFRVDPAKVPATGVRARCSVCGGIIAIAGGTLPVSVTPTAATPAVPAFAGGAVRRTPTVTTPTAATPMAATATTPTPTTPSAATPVVRATPAASPAVRTPTPSPVVRAPTPSAGANTLAGSGSRAATLTPPASEVSERGAHRRSPINPFLRADPAQRARRLARALVSDLVAYHPQKREDGLRDGTLRQLFREEIKKSYEEYVEQVGRDVAEGASHFQDALNEILAGGRRLF